MKAKNTTLIIINSAISGAAMTPNIAAAQQSSTGITDLLLSVLRIIHRQMVELAASEIKPTTALIAPL